MTKTLANQTIEFRLPDETIPIEWLRIGERIWNDGLTLLNWRQHYLRLQECLEVPDPDNIFDLSHPVAIEKIKFGDNYYLHCWIGKDTRIDKSKSWDKDNIEFIPSIKLVRSHWNETPPIDGRSGFTLCKQFTKKAGYDYSPLPSGIMQWILGNLADSWAKYLKTGAGKPKYKGARNPLTSLTYDGFRNHCRIDNGNVKLMGLSEIKVAGIDRLQRKIDRTYQYLLENPSDRTKKAIEKLGVDVAAKFYSLPGSYTLIVRPNGHYIQFSGELAVNLATPRTESATIVIGSDSLYKIEGKEISIDTYDTSKIQSRIINLQKILATKKTHSKNWRKLQDKIRLLQRKQSQTNRRHQQYHAQWIADRYGEITVDKVSPEIVLVPAPIPDGDGNYQPNGAEIVAANNVRVAKLAAGQFSDLIKQKCLVKNRVFCGKMRKELGTPATVLNSPNLEIVHGQAEGNDSQTGGNRKRLPTSKTTRQTRNRRREKAIG